MNPTPPQSEREKLLADLQKYLIDSGVLEAHDKNAIHLSDEANRTLSVIAIAEHLADFILKEKVEAYQKALDLFEHRIDCCTLISELEGWKGAVEQAKYETEQQLAALTPKTTKDKS